MEENPFLVPLEEKVDLLMRADRGLGGRREVVSRTSQIRLRREEQWMATSDGGRTHQVLVRSGGRIEALSSAGKGANAIIRQSSPRKTLSPSGHPCRCSVMPMST